MSNNRKDKKGIYKNVKYAYSVYGENEVYGGSATVTIDVGASTNPIMLVLNVDFPSLEEAEAEIIEIIERKIDSLV